MGTTRQFNLPVWVLGVSQLPYGIVGGLVYTTIPQVLQMQHLPQSRIAELMGIALSPLFWGFIFCPTVDIKFTHKAYSIVFTLIASVVVSIELCMRNHVLLLTSLLTFNYLITIFIQSATGGWFAKLVRDDQHGLLSAWMNIGNNAGMVISATVGLQLIDHVSVIAAAAALGLIGLVPLVVLFHVPTVPVQATEPGRDAFSHLVHDAAGLFKSKGMLVSVLMFVLPCASFGLTGLLSTISDAYSASPGYVSMGSVLSLAGGIVGVLAFALIAKRISASYLYLAVGIIGSILTIGLLAIPADHNGYIVAAVVEGTFQAIGFTGAVTVGFEMVSKHSIMPATTIAVVSAAFNLSADYSMVAGGNVFDMFGLGGVYLFEGGIGIVSCIIMIAVLILFRPRMRRR